ncbi:glycoside hydrolase family 57 protein [Methanoregula sp.]|jgi:alpha-amylase|uniref:glycoside hydrolase family 57 protein n=1 Tax=Methanoregula sp. TaxID=2052170 RepID=UPI003C183AB4
MPQICMGFEVHQPYRLNRLFSPAPKLKKKDLFDQYFDGLNKEILLRVAEKCYNPATKIILEKLDEGFACSFSLSGTLIEQLEKWSPDTLSLFEAVARHRNTELIGQTYYHSIASCFSDKSEFREQVRMHSDLMFDHFRVRPTIFENTEFTFNNEVAATVKDMDFAGIFTEGVDRILGWRSPNYVYQCQGIPVMLRNTTLSDDIAFRFTNRTWDMYPLTADTYAQWIASSPGDVINIFLDYETFGEHCWQETGIFDFLRSLPGELAQRGVEPVLPSQVVARNMPVGEIDVQETISWADLEKDTSAWMGNERQQTAFHAIQAAKTYAIDKPIWRYLQTSDHFYYMASKYGTCGEVHTYFSHHDAEDAFKTYMRVLADFESRNVRVMKNRKSAKTLRTLPPELAFHFAGPSGFIGHAAYNLDQFEEQLYVVPMDSIAYHQEREDFYHWINDVLEDQKLAESIRGIGERHELIAAVKERRELLWSHLK